MRYEDYSECSLEFRCLGLKLRINADLVDNLKVVAELSMFLVPAIRIIFFVPELSQVQK